MATGGLEAKGFRAARVGFGRRLFSKKPAKIAEIFLVGRGLFSLEPIPLPFELSLGHLASETGDLRYSNLSFVRSWESTMPTGA
jgi:hypothetical protein